jgi:hypothetical protein
MRGRFYGLVGCLIYQAPNAAARIASAANSPLPNATGGQKRPTDAGLSDVGISYDQFSRWQKLAAVPEEIFERQMQDKTHVPTMAGLIRAAAEPWYPGDQRDRN